MTVLHVRMTATLTVSSNPSTLERHAVTQVMMRSSNCGIDRLHHAVIALGKSRSNLYHFN